MVDMEAVRQFNSELSTIYETKPPISKGKVASITRLAVKAIKYYKHVVQSVEKFTQKCRQEYKVPALYIIDSIIRQSRHQFGADKDVFGPRFAKSITVTFQHLYKCPPEDQGRIVKVLNLWQKGGVYSPEVVQPLLNMAQQCQNEEPSQSNKSIMSSSSSSSAINIGNETQPSDAIPGNGTSVLTALQQQQQQHLEQIENLRRQLQEQQSINQQQQQQLAQQMSGVNNPMTMTKPMTMEPTVPFGNAQVQHGVPPAQPGILQPPQQGVLQPSQAVVLPEMGATQNTSDDQPRFQLQPHVLAQIQALTGMNIRLPQAPPNQDEVQGASAPSQQAPPILGPEPGGPPLGQGPVDQGSSWGHPALAPLGRHPEQTHQQPPRKDQGVIDDFDYGDEQDDATRLAEQRRRLMEEERRLSQDQMTMEGDRHHNRSPGHRRRSQSPYRRNRSPRRKSRSPRRRSRSPRSRDRGRDRDRDRERGRDRDRERDRDRDKEREEVEEEPENKGLPPVIPNSCSVCSNTIWMGHLAKTVQQNDLQEIFAENGEVTSIDMVPPRGCAYVQMAKREDASKALNKLANLRLHGNFAKFAWAPAKGVKDRKFKEYFNVSLGVTYIPWEVLGSAPDLSSISEGGWIDPESLPVELKTLNLAEAGETTGEDKGETKEGEQTPLASGVLPPQIPTHLPPPPIFPPMMPPHMMMRPPFQGGPHNPNMMPPERPPWGMNVPGGPPPGFGQGVPPPQGMRPTGGGQFPHHQGGEGRPPFQPRLPMGMPPRGQEPGGMRQFRPRFHEGPRPRGPMEFDRPPRRDFDFDGPPPRRGFGGPPPRGHNGPPPRGPEGMIPRGLEGPPSGMDEPHRRQHVPPQGIDEPQRVTEGPYGMEEGVPRGPEGAPRGPEGPPAAHNGSPKGDEGPPRPEGPRQDSEGPPQMQHDGPPRGPNGPFMRFEGTRAGMEGHLAPEGMPGGPMRPPFRGMNGPPGAPNGPPRGPEGLLREPDFRPQFRPDFRGGPHGPPPRHWGPPHDRPMGMPPMRMPQPEWLRGPPPPERMKEERPSTDTNTSNEQQPGPKEERPEQRPDRPEQQPEKPDNRPGDEHGDLDRGQHSRRDRDRNERPPWDRDRDRERDRDRRRDRDRDRPRSRERDRDRGRDRSRDRETSRDRDRDRDRERERSRDRETSRDRDRDRRDRDRRDRDRDRDRDRRDRDRDRRDRDRRRSYNDRDSRRSSDSDNKSDRQIKSELSKEIPTTTGSKEGIDAAAGQTEQPTELGQSSNESNVQNPSVDSAIQNNKIATPEEGEVIEDENNSHITPENENKQVELQIEASNDTKIKIEELKAAVEDPLKTLEEQNVAQNSSEEINTAGMNIEIKQETNSEQIETT